MEFMVLGMVVVIVLCKADRLLLEGKVQKTV